MIDPIPADQLPDEQTVAAFGARLEAYAATLPEREHQMLQILILRAMDPVERMRWRDLEALLSDREEAVLRALAEEE